MVDSSTPLHQLLFAVSQVDAIAATIYSYIGTHSRHLYSCRSSPRALNCGRSASRLGLSEASQADQNPMFGRQLNHNTLVMIVRNNIQVVENQTPSNAEYSPSPIPAVWLDLCSMPVMMYLLMSQPPLSCLALGQKLADPLLASNQRRDLQGIGAYPLLYVLAASLLSARLTIAVRRISGELHSV